MAETYKYGLRDLDGKPVPDSRVTPIIRSLIKSTGDYDKDIKKTVYAYNGQQRILLSDIDMTKYIVKFIAGLWRFREKPTKTYRIAHVWDKNLVLGDKIDIRERDDFNFRYYTASVEKYDMFGILNPEFNLYIAACNTKNGVRLRYGQTREDARAFLRGAIMDEFGPNIASMVIQDRKQNHR